MVSGAKRTLAMLRPEPDLFIFSQIENEYGAFGYDDQPRDKAYLRIVKEILEKNGIESLLFTSDSPKQTTDMGSLEGGD